MEKKTIYILIAIVVLVLALVITVSMSVGKTGANYLGGVTGTETNRSTSSTSVEGAGVNAAATEAGSAMERTQAVKRMAESRKEEVDALTRQR